jgi:hypothetical protein
VSPDGAYGGWLNGAGVTSSTESTKAFGPISPAWAGIDWRQAVVRAWPADRLAAPGRCHSRCGR